MIDLDDLTKFTVGSGDLVEKTVEFEDLSTGEQHQAKVMVRVMSYAESLSLNKAYRVTADPDDETKQTVEVVNETLVRAASIYHCVYKPNGDKLFASIEQAETLTPAFGHALYAAVSEVNYAGKSAKQSLKPTKPSPT